MIVADVLGFSGDSERFEGTLSLQTFPPCIAVHARESRVGVAQQ